MTKRAQMRTLAAENGDSDEAAGHTEADAIDPALGRLVEAWPTLPEAIHLLCDAHGHPLHFHLTAGQDHEATALKPLLEGADESLVDHQGEPVAWPLQLAGDKAYGANWIDEYLLSLEIQPVIPSKSNEDQDDRAVEF